MGKYVFIKKDEVDALIGNHIDNTTNGTKSELEFLQEELGSLETFEFEIEEKSEMCSCFELKERVRYLYDRYTGKPDSMYMQQYGVCNGTKERDEVDCNGNRFSKDCIYYKEHIAKRTKENGKV